MHFSCFDPRSGLYDYYVDGEALPINADLPVPKMPRAAGKIGVPAMDAGRPLPAGAQHVGRGWHAKGLVVQCGRGSLGAMPTVSGAVDWVAGGGWKWIAGGALAVWLVRRMA